MHTEVTCDTLKHSIKFRMCINFVLVYLTFNCDLDLELTHGQHAHSLVEVNVSFKFKGNSFIGKGVIERTRIGDRRADRPTDRWDKTNPV